MGQDDTSITRWRKAGYLDQWNEYCIEVWIYPIFSAHKGMVGSPLVTADLRDEDKLSKVSRPRVARIRRKLGLRGKPKFVVTTDSKHDYPVAPNLCQIVISLYPLLASPG